VSARRAEDAREVQARIESLMRQRRRIAEDEEDDFAVRDLREISQVVGAVTGVLTALLGAIAAVSLLVGGIGIMNIMLVSVTERTREIGIRLAIGARAREILWQFLIEAIVLSTLGGIAGIALGLAGSWLAARGLGLPFVWVPEIVLAAFVFAAVVGVFFGWYPALRAARLNPIEALRHE
jgi:putative ABC transport system permease protein